MNRFSSVRVRMVGIVFLAVAPALVVLVCLRLDWLWPTFVIGLLALAAAWVGGELSVLRQIKSIQACAVKLAAGDLTSRTELDEPTEFGALARSLNKMAETLERQNREREIASAILLNRSYQQTCIAAVGQFALVTADINALFNQAALLISQTLDVDFCMVLELQPDEKSLLLTAGHGWNDGSIGKISIETGNNSQAGFTLVSGEPVVVKDLRDETRFPQTDFLKAHGAVSGVTVIIGGHNQPFGVLGIHAMKPRVFNEEEVHFLQTIATLFAMAVERQRTEPEIQKLAAFAKFNPNPVLEFSNDGRLTYFNEAAQKLATLLGESRPQAMLPPDTANIVQTCLATGQNRLQLETRPASRILSWSFYPIMASQVVHCYVEDITDRASLEEQFRQVQKMESVGQLAAGVAHDFNNILTIIQGHSGLLMSRPNLSPAMTSSIQAIGFAAERAASLTRQLLMFSRKQVMQPKAIDLKDVVSNMSKMLQRLIGETITLQCKYPPQLPPIRGDAGMMEQILMNLAVNARDAMPKGGQLVISVDAVTVPETYTKLHTDARTGEFVCLQVGDTGTGMDAATMKRIFEPFFTTKEPGRGTGLGLATVYGIVKQHQGWIDVNSEIGKGTVFRIFFPVTVRDAESGEETTIHTAQVRGGGETILIVEDEPVLLDLAQLILQDCGYRVISATSGVEALGIWQHQGGSVDLLLTDMIMPDGLSGKDLADTLLGHKPGLRVLFTSGYNVEEIGTDVGRKNGTHFLQKPYTRITLAKAVRDCLDS